MTLPEQMLGLVVAPVPRGPAGFAPPQRPGALARVVVLAGAADASAASAAVALALARRARASFAVALSWGCSGEDPPPVGALPAAARSAARLQRCGFEATAAGRLVRVVLGGDAQEAVAGWRVLAREAAPVAFAVAGPRSEQLDRDLGRTDAIVVVVARDSPSGLVAATQADARGIGPAVAIADMRLGAATRGLLALGYGVPPRIRAAIDEALG